MSFQDTELAERVTAMTRDAAKIMTNVEGVLRETWDRPQMAASESTQDQVTRLGVRILAKEADTILKMANYLPDGTYNLRDAIKLAEKIPFIGSFDGPGVRFLKGFDTITKEGNHFKLTRNSDATFPLDHKVDGTMGRVTADSVRVGRNVEFDIQPNGRDVKLANLQGVSVDATGDFVIAKSKYNAKVKEVTLTHDAKGETVMNAKMENPSKLSRIAGSASDVNVKVPVDEKKVTEILIGKAAPQYLELSNPY